jgi:PAS domain S-box-containing protein/putative nucleotidyltransferase with HDIG domain
MMSKKIRVLHLEDTPSDAELIKTQIKRAGLECEWLWVENEEGFIRALREQVPDIILADYKLPSYNGEKALFAALEICPHVPFIVVTGTLGEEKAVELMRNGATDYVLKDRLVRLSESIHHALDNAESNRARREIQEKLVESESLLREAQAISHIGSWYTELGNDNSYWSEETFRIFGLEPDKEAHDINAFIEEYVVTEDRPRIRRCLQEVLAGNGDFECEFRVIHSDGSQRWVQEHGRLIRDKDGHPLRLAGTNLDITERKLAELERMGMLRKIEQNLKQFISAITRVLEQRDPYTAGHQLRVADLALSIASEMGLDAERCKSVHLAGLMHDLGKISIPAELLSKPGRLNEIEYMMVKRHPEVGYEIIKDIDFPWPIAKMVRQHHERLDGSGYPHGLKGEDILLEARILSVADVVEAMSSHRPYRPGLGLEAALEEITKHKGEQFDPAVVDSCIRLFREQGYTFTISNIGSKLE